MGRSEKPLDGSTRLRPFDFEPIELRPIPNAQHHARIVRGEVASAADFHAATLQIAGLVRDASANRVDICFLANQLKSQPVIQAAGVVLQEDGRLVVAGNQYINRAVIVEIAERETACRTSDVRKAVPLSRLTFFNPPPVLWKSSSGSR